VEKVDTIQTRHALKIAIGITMLALLLVGGAEATKLIRNDVTGGDCPSIGTWNAVTKTCTLTMDLTETIQIDSNDITLDGNGHTITGSNTGYGVDLDGRIGVTIRNIRVRQFSIGIHLISSSNNNLTGNIAYSNNGHGIYLQGSNNNKLTGNIAYSNNGEGIPLFGSTNNTLVGNLAYSNLYGGIWLQSTTMPVRTTKRGLVCPVPAATTHLSTTKPTRIPSTASYCNLQATTTP
jgi:parallel beta-helix repeat protein